MTIAYMTHHLLPFCLTGPLQSCTYAATGIAATLCSQACNVLERVQACARLESHGKKAELAPFRVNSVSAWWSAGCQAGAVHGEDDC